MKLSDYSKEIMTVCRKHGVASLAVFGSVLADQFTPASDIDFLVVFQNREIKGSFDRYFNLKEDLERLLDTPVDLICENQIRNPFFKNTVSRSKQVLYAA